MGFSTSIRIPHLAARNQRILERLNTRTDDDQVLEGFLLFAELEKLEAPAEMTPLQVFEESWSALQASKYSMDAISEFKLKFEATEEPKREMILVYFIRLAHKLILYS